MTWLLVVLSAAAVYRLVVLVRDDTITERPREWVTAKSPAKVGDLIECPWCLGFWCSVLVVVPVVVWPEAVWVQAPVAVLAVSAVVGVADGFLAPQDDVAPDPVPTVLPALVGVERDAVLDLRARMIGWSGDQDLLRVRAKQGVLSPSEAVAFDTIALCEEWLRSPVTPDG